MELINSNILSANNVGQGSNSQMKQSEITLQKEHLVNKLSNKIKKKVCFQTSIKKLKKSLKYESSHASHRYLLIRMKRLHAECDDLFLSKLVFEMFLFK